MSKLAKHKASIRAELLADHRRKGYYKDMVSPCEGQSYKLHYCNSGVQEMNEVIYSKQKFKGVPAKHKIQFYSVYNCSLNCRWFHTQHGHSRAFRDWFVERVVRIYGDEVLEWASSLPMTVNEELYRIRQLVEEL